MPVYYEDFFDLLTEICKHKKVLCTVKYSVTGAVITGAFAGLGGLLLGPVGLGVGGALGGLVAGSTSPKFASLPEILINMSEKQKEELCNKVVYAFRDFGLSDIATVASVVVAQTSMKNIAIEAVENYLSKEMGLKVCM